MFIAQDPQCTSDGDCTSPAETCSSGFCECPDGMRRSYITEECEWLVDVVCHKVTAIFYIKSDVYANINFLNINFILC